LDRDKHVQHVKDTALDVAGLILKYEDKSWFVTRQVYDSDRHRLMCESGQVKDMLRYPADESKLDQILANEKTRRAEFASDTTENPFLEYLHETNEKDG
jgi:hypothetical protein